MKQLRKWIAVLLTVSMTVSIMPISAFAKEAAEEHQISVRTLAEENETAESSSGEASQETEEPEVVPEPAPEPTPEEPEVAPEPEPEAPSEPEQTGEVTSEEENEISQEPSLASIPPVGNRFADAFIDVLNKAGITTTITNDESGITLTIGDGDGRILELLSQQEQTDDSNYQNWNIYFSSTGNINLSDEYLGLGDSDFPFMGKFTGQSITIISSKTIFKALNANADLNNVKISWSGKPNVPILTGNLITDETDHEIKMPLTTSTYFSPYIGQLTGGTGLVTLPALDYSSADDSDTQEIYGSDAGLACGSMAAGTKLKIGKLTLLNNTVYLRSSGSVGSLVGRMEENSKLIISQDLTLDTRLSGANAGGLVGNMTNGIINFVENTSAEISTELTAASGAAGGIAGVVSTGTGPLGTNANVKLVSVKANGAESAGVYYGKCTVTGEFTPTYGVTCAADAITEVSGSGYCGGVFGTLALNENGKCKLIGTDENRLKISTTLTTAANTTKYGGIAGVVSPDTVNASDARKNALVVEKCEVTSNIGVGNDSTKYPKYVGGIAAVQDKVTVDVKTITTNFITPKTITGTDYGFGGLISYVGDDALLMAESVKVITDSYNSNPGGGGVVGSAYKGSIVYLKTSLDLSDCPLTTNATTGQIVGKQECSLVYAPRVTIKRYKKISELELDDIGNYGEMYRIAEFLSVDPSSYAVTFSHTLSKTGDEYQLSNAQDYACLALAWQTRGYFPTVSGITKDNWSDLKNNTCKIKLNDNIDLDGTGIGGLTRDVSGAEDTFYGSLDGNGKKITLDIGAENQDQDSTSVVSKGDGRIYRHNATGLFAVLSNKASISNLTLAGSIRISNNQVSRVMASGGLAANLYCNETSNNLISGVSTEVNIHIFEKERNSLYVGGIFGQVIGKSSTTLNLNAGLNASIILAENVMGNGNYHHIGGAIGAIDKDANITIECGNNENALILAGAIEYKNQTDNIYAGGLVGTIFPGGEGKRTVNIWKLTVNNFTLSGNARDRMGGILGGIWANTDVNISGLTVSSATLRANGSAELGGLVYRANGKWTVSSADLAKLKIIAESAKALGLMVCQGGLYKDYFNGSYVNVDGLYLEMTEHWNWDDTAKKGYRVPSISSFSGNVFDEFVAYTGYSDRANNTQNCQITENGSGIISLKTDNDTINMTEKDRNTYVNRTLVGKEKQTNLYSRYYYNLPKEKSACNGGSIDTPQELLIWSVYRYAAPNLRSYFIIDNGDVTVETIGGSSSTNRADFDMKGLSYYPINRTNTDVTVQYADVQFYNNDIETKENGNKSTRGDASDHSQHYTMHCGLFMNFDADLTNAIKAEDYYDRTMIVNGVSFAGSVGVINGGSGALLCGTVKGATKEGNTSIRRVILADSDDATKSVSLNGITVAPEGDYTPVLINTFGSYSGLKANYICTTAQQTMKAGSSLIGNVGEQGATGISVEFEGTIKLPDLKSYNIFSKATLLNSLQYENGTATYHFLKNKDYNDFNYREDNRETTYGSEISGSVEYNGKNGCYYDGYGKGYFVSKTGNFDTINDFQGYLPYVAYSPATDALTYPLANGWHELAVNILSTDLTEGCGTYGHPYQVDANLLKEVANYINTGSASNGWKIRIAANDVYHIDEDSNDMVITYNGSVWKNSSDEVYQGNVQQYLADAYYEIKEETIILKDFNGIGTNVPGGVPFTGVITGKKGTGTTIELSGGSTAFIKYSYGCVVRDISIVLNQGNNLSLERPTWTRGEAEQAPKTFFGGVIGCVLGGDNIIENVTVSKNELTIISTSGTNPYLIPIGGYVGVIAGGGVIFRGTYSNDTGITGTDAQLYRNPIIGRVLGGYAYYEGTGDAPNNGDKNYKINKIEYTSADLNWNDSTLTVNNAQGLLLLSGIISSGAGSAESNAYKNGKARNAAYNHIGDDTEPEDYAIAKKDTSAVWYDENTPYLLSKYAGYTGNASICNSSSSSIDGIDIVFAQNGSFDMSGYDNGYRGLSARYVSNAAFGGDNPTNPVQAGEVVLRVKSFNGNSVNVQNINMNVKEYENDDFHAVSMGGIFNIVWTKNQGGGTPDSTFAQNLTLTSCNVSLKYVDSGGIEKPQAKLSNTNTDNFADEDGLSCVAVGGFIGSVSDLDGSGQSNVESNYLFTNIHISGQKNNTSNITGPMSAGGIIGASAMTNSKILKYPGKLLSNSKPTTFGPSFLNCSYNYTNITGKMAAGGLAGYVYAGGDTTVIQFTSLGISTTNENPGCYASCTVTDKNLIVGSNSTICAEAKQSVAGGIFGAAGMRVRVNHPDINSKTGLPITNDNKDNIQTLCLKNVTVKSSQNNETIYQGNGTTTNGPTNGSSGEASAGGIVSRIGSVNPTYFCDINLNGCTISTNKQTNTEYAGGIVGYGYTNTYMIMQRCQMEDSTVDSKNSGGFLGYGHSYTTKNMYTLNMSDCKIEDSEVKGSEKSGGIVGVASSKYCIFNVLIKNTSITGSNTGRLFGWMNINENNNNFWVYAAGISVYADKDNITIPSNDGNADTGRQYIGYISYADYTGTDTPTLDSGDASPYVTVNPNFTLDGVNKRLTGDAVGKIENDAYGSAAARIWADQKTGATGKKNLVSYANAAAIVNMEGKASPVVSTFNVEQGCGPELPVLVLNASDAGVIEDYLNVITNGGYKESGVSLTRTVYYYNKDTNTFALADESQLSLEPASIYLSDGKPRVTKNSFDNTRNRFTLIEASFTVTVNRQERIYTVSVPVIVKRQLQYNFMSTFSYGAEFNSDTFKNLTTHVLESTGNPFTAYLTYQYNREGKEYVDYDWQTYMNDGGNMMSVDKVLSFSSGLPRGTQLTLVDCQNGNRAYRYETTDEFTSTKTDIPLSSFNSVTNGASFQASMAEILGVESKESDSGNYVVETNVSNATLRLKNNSGGYTYYRPLASDETTQSQRYDLVVPDLSKNVPEENYYLVINVPNQGDGFYINGSLSSSLRWTMPSKGTWLHRYNKSTTPQVGNNDESTYQISTGYKQVLSSTANSESINLASADKKMQVKARDTITFSNQQVYGDNDQLFMKLTVDLQEHTADSQDVSEIQFPAGTTGKVHFYIQDVEGSYYVFDGTSWSKNQEGAEAASYDWISQGANMELLLSKDGRTALDLSGVRKLIKGNQSSGDSQIIITAEMDIDFNSQEVLNATIPGSEKNGADKWVQLHYTGRISTQAYSLGYSTVRAVAEDNAKYYRGVKHEAILSMDATSISQLGINPLELVPEYLTTINGRKASRIDLIAALNLANLQDIEGVLANTESITFSLSLTRGGKGSYETEVADASNYVGFDLSAYGSIGWSWTIPKEQFYQNGQIVKSNIFDGTQFTMPITAYVFTNQKDFANYKIKLTVSFNDESNIQITDTDAYVIYTFACIKPEFYDPTEHTTTSNP